MRPVTACLLLLATVTAAADPTPPVRLGEGKVLWSQEPQVYGYAISGPLPGQRRMPYVLRLSTDTLGPRGELLAPTSRHQLGAYAALSLPGKRVSLNGKTSFSRSWDSIPELGPVKALIRWQHTGTASWADVPCETITLRVSLASRPLSKRGQLKGKVEGELYWSPARKQVIGFKLTQSWRYLDAETQKLSEESAPIEAKLIHLITPQVSDAEFSSKVNAAIKTSAAFLLERRDKKAHLWKTGYGIHWPMGNSALCVLALLSSNEIAPDDKRIEQSIDAILKLPRKKNYGVSIALMMLAARYTPHPEALRQMTPEQARAALAKVAAQVPAARRAWADEATAWLLANATHAEKMGEVKVEVTGKHPTVPTMRWYYPGTHAGEPSKTGYDNSNTQYVVLALRAAARLGVTVHSKVWRGVMRHWMESQQQNGPSVQLIVPGAKGSTAVERARARGFDYYNANSKDRRPYGSMTVAGLGCLAIARDELRKAKAMSEREAEKIDEAIRDATAWMQEHFAVDHNPIRGSAHHLYYLYGLERAALLAGITRFGTHDWYREGALELFARQRPNGAWGHRDAYTCFGLLFLKRATVSVIKTGDE